MEWERRMLLALKEREERRPGRALGEVVAVGALLAELLTDLEARGLVDKQDRITPKGQTLLDSGLPPS